ncbi:zinc finger and SCAN domain-containing protein 2-like isoform X2 [Clupea harengus]|uniref:Zinc finger and SCAN domain-containing protein 2-like isoform X2 n=1 Tax=Clupea harengus TaxID=7950 RepID=A0A6P8F2U3_CLUHA|nr:zinc finger and SCAN domain-containing protein 2-like isoform X2 [Clupea harengus]
MSRRRCVLRCEGKSPLYALPKVEQQRSQWLNFVFTNVPSTVPNILLCVRHFTEDCFKNRAQFDAGFSQLLLLKDGAIPTLCGPSGASGSQPQDTDRQISEVCVVQGCSRTSQLQSFPTDPALRQQWMTCLVGRLKHPVNPSSSACSAHFTADCFMNGQQNQSGVAPSLTLKADALPTLFIGNSNKMQPWPLERRSVACQCDPPRKSVGTQLSKNTLLSVRSKATQTPAVTHISLDESVDFMASGAKITMRESRETKSDSSLMLNRDTLVSEAVVQIASLLQLFQRCLGCCSQVCRITTRRDGPVLHVVQQCWTCRHRREWASHPPDHLFTDPADSHQAEEESVERSCEDIDIDMEEEMTEEEEEEEEEQEQEEQKSKRKRNDSDDEWAPSIEGFMQTSDKESGSEEEEEEDRPFMMAWCRDCGEESSTCCSEQDHRQLYCCVQCGYREDHQGPACTDGQETQNMDNPKAPTASNQEVTCDVKQEDDSNNKLTASSGCLGDSNSSQGVLTCGSQHAIASGNQEATSNSQQSATSEDLNSITDQGLINCDKLHNNRNGNQGPPSNDVSELSCSKEQGSVNSSAQGVTTTEGQEDTSSSDQDSNTTSQLESSNSCHQEETVSKETHNIPMFAIYFSDLYSLQSHVEQSHGFKRELCPDCGKFIIRRDSRCSHVCDHKIKPFSCLTCGRCFTSPSGLHLHSQVHTEGHALPCRYCYKTFRFQEDKLEHEKIHLEERLKYRCPDCPKRFTDRYSRSAHRKTHWKHGRFFCKVCDKGFFKACQLERHEVVHTGLKPYACEQCDRSFNQPGHLKSHMRVHTGERPFKCQDCGQCFNHNVSLKNHMQRHHGPNGDEGEGETEEIGDDYDEYVL